MTLETHHTCDFVNYFDLKEFSFNLNKCTCCKELDTIGSVYRPINK